MPKLILNPTSSNRREILLARTTILTIGRDPSNDLVLPDAMVSRRHAVIEHRGSQFFLRDCSSANGSVVNGDRVSERGLRDGDLVAIGSMRLLFREEPVDAAGGGKVVPHPSAAPLACPSCGGAFRRGDLFCRECGAQVAQPSGPPRAVCPACGTAVPLPARFCSACGTTLAASGERLDEPSASPVPSARATLASPPAGVSGPFASGSMAMAARAESAPAASSPDVTPLGLRARERRDRVPAPARPPEPAAGLAGPRLLAFAID
ncbi:MAG TPA: FHA domain-containing protein, partial [Vicinamibacteria bacterium]|nr:FHA domain-containing protein [Vicinamibacteria bacterium]